MRTGGEICERCINGGYHHAVIHRCVGGSVTRSILCAVELAVHRWTRIYEQHVARFIVPSRFYRQKMIEAGLPADRLEWIPNFTQVERYTPSYDGGDYFVYFGRLSEEKGLSTLVDAVRTFTRATLLIVGDGPARPALERATARLTHIRLLGPKYGSELLDLVRGARFSVIPSEWYENCSMSCIESFACGTPVIAANIGGLPEMVEPYETGLLFAPSSAGDLREKIEYLFARPEEAARMGKAARAKAEREYGARRHLDRLVELYHETLAARYRATA
jgi:glycosyltransferase involved in cell wall biosynthesis